MYYFKEIAFSKIYRFSFSFRHFSVIYAISTIPGMSIIKRVIMNFHPIEDASNNSIGVLVVRQALIKIKTLENLLPLFMRTPATGAAGYNGPAAAEPSFYCKINEHRQVKQFSP